MKNKKIKKSNAGFTLIEILVVIGIIAILAAIVLIAINPARQFAQARNSQRSSGVNASLNAITQKLADDKGLFKDCLVNIPAVDTSAAGFALTTGIGKKIADNNPVVGDADLACLSNLYIANLPFDPSASGAHWTGTTDYDAGYRVLKDTNTSRITVFAPDTELTAETGSYDYSCANVSTKFTCLTR